MYIIHLKLPYTHLIWARFVTSRLASYSMSKQLPVSIGSQDLMIARYEGELQKR